MSASLRFAVQTAFVYVCWLGMMAVHESGHVAHAWLSGGQVERVLLPWFGFSRTDLLHNPHPLFVAWGGALWGSMIPPGLFALAATFRFRLVRWIQFFAGFCLIANGAYLAGGSLIGAGDAGDLMRHGVPRWTLVATGIPGVVAGLFLWHRLGLPKPADQPAADVADEEPTR